MDLKNLTFTISNLIQGQTARVKKTKKFKAKKLSFIDSILIGGLTDKRMHSRKSRLGDG